MPLIDCPDCGKPVSDQAAACIGCGRPLAIDHGAPIQHADHAQAVKEGVQRAALRQDLGKGIFWVAFLSGASVAIFASGPVGIAMIIGGAIIGVWLTYGW